MTFHKFRFFKLFCGFGKTTHLISLKSFTFQGHIAIYKKKTSKLNTT